MAYTPTAWLNRIVERPRTFTFQQNADGSITLIPAPGVVTQEGTPFSANNMNKIETELQKLDNGKADLSMITNNPGGTSPIVSNFKNRQDAVTATSFSFAVPMKYQFFLLTILVTTNDYNHMYQATYLIKNFAAFQADLLGAAYKKGVITALSVANSESNIVINVTASVSIAVRCCTTQIYLNQDM